jgi:hypothetical protein
VPVTPPVVGGVYDPAYSILNAARFRLNDKLKSLAPTSGKILDETQASTQQAFNNGYRRFQEKLADSGVERFHGQVDIFGIPPVTNLDPASQCSISWFQFFDGSNYWITPVLPMDLMTPLWMSERPSNTQFPFPRVDQPNMKCQTDGLQSARKYQRNGQWEWRGEVIYFPGSTIAVDFRIRYRSYLPDLADLGSERWFNLAVPIMRCQDPLSWWVCAEFAAARAADGDAAEAMLQVAGECKEEAIEATKIYANRDVMKNQRDDVRRLPYGGGSRGRGGSTGWGFRG